MVDEIFDREYQTGRKELNSAFSNAFGRLSRGVGNAFEVLVNIEYDAPWTAKSRGARCN